jgi:hypothetical protein
MLFHLGGDINVDAGYEVRALGTTRDIDAMFKREV